MRKIILTIIALAFVASVSYADLPTTPVPGIPTSVVALPVGIKVSALEFATQDRAFRLYKHYRMANREMETPYDPAKPAGLTVSDWYMENCVILFLVKADYKQKMLALAELGLNPEVINLKQAADMAPIIEAELAVRTQEMITYIQAQ